MTTCKEEALRWVHRYAVGGAAFAAIPVSTSAGLAAIEAHMISFIGNIYGDPLGGPATAATSGMLAVGGQALKYLAMQATRLMPLAGIPIRMGIAGGTIEALGRGIVAHYERKYANKAFAHR
jgi:uncharacterized protein (DUF697 family)